MGLTDREAYLELRARYLRLVAALRSTRESNPETLAAIERILQPEQTDPQPPQIPLPIPQKKHSEERRQHAA